MPEDPLSDLIDALTQGTTAKSVQWEQASMQGDAFIARSPSGTVTLQGPGTLGIGAVGIAGPSVQLTVKDESGKTIERYNAVAPNPLALAASGIAAALAGKTSPDARIVQLWWDVREQQTKARSTMRALTKEFKPSK